MHMLAAPTLLVVTPSRLIASLLAFMVDTADAAPDRLPNPFNGLALAEMVLDAFADDLAHPVTHVMRNANVGCVGASVLIVAYAVRLWHP
jgi:hypothetical protein